MCCKNWVYLGVSCKLVKIRVQMKVYKYRSNDDRYIKRDLKTFSENKFFASTFENLNDPFEANYNELITESSKILENLFNVSSKDVLEGFDEIVKYKDKLGIFSLSKNVLSEQMWAHYSNSNYGYCIEYDFGKIIERNQNYDVAFNFEIKYNDILPIITIDDIRNPNMAIKMFGTKKENWSYEKEIRLVFDSASLKEHHESAITGIYFGYKAEKSLIEKFKEKFKNRDITFYQIRPNRSSNLLEYIEIDRFSRKLLFDLDKFNFEVIKIKNNSSVCNYYIYLKDIYNKEELLELSKAFIEKHNFKPSNLYYLNSKSAETLKLVDKYPKSDDEYVKWAETIIADFPFDCDKEIFIDPLKDWHYKELKNKVYHK